MNWYKRQLKIAMPKRVNWSEDDLQVMKSLVEEGHTYKNIADLFGVSIATIRRINKEHGWRERKEWGPMEGVRESILEKGRQMVDMYLLSPRGQGMTLKNISRQFNITTNTVKDYMKRTGLINDEEFRSKEETDKEHSKRMLEWWKQFEGEDGQKFKNRLLSYPTRQQAIGHLYVLVNTSKDMVTSPEIAGSVYGKYIQIINNHTYPDEVQQEEQIQQHRQETIASMNWYKRQLKISYIKKWLEEDIEAIKKLIEKGISFGKIAPMFGVHRDSIRTLNNKYRWREAAKLKKDNFISSLYLLPPEGKGMPVAQIFKEYGFSSSRTMGALKRLGLFEKNWRGVSEAAKNKFKNNPELAREHSQRMKQRFIDNPDLGKEQSERMIQKWEEWGGMEGFLLSYPTRGQAVDWLDNFKRRNYGANPQRTMGAYNKYMKIVNDHTYLDEVQQPQPV